MMEKLQIFKKSSYLVSQSPTEFSIKSIDKLNSDVIWL